MQLLALIKDSFVDLYEYLLKLILLNLLMFAVLVLPVLLSFPLHTFSFIFLLFVLIISGPVIISGFKIIYGLKNRDSFSLKKFIRGIKHNFKKGLKAFLFTAAVYGVLIVDIYFFLQRSENIFMLIMAMLSFYVFIFFSLMQVYFWGLLTVGDEKITFKNIIKKSALLVIDNIFFILGIGLFMIIITIIFILFSLAVPAIYIVFMGLLLINTTNYTLKKYQLKQEEV